MTKNEFIEKEIREACLFSPYTAKVDACSDCGCGELEAVKTVEGHLCPSCLLRRFNLLSTRAIADQLESEGKFRE